MRSIITQFSWSLRYFPLLYRSLCIALRQLNLCAYAQSDRYNKHTLVKVSLRISYALLGAFAKFRKATTTFVMSVCLSARPPAPNTSAPTGRIFVTFYILSFLRNRRVQVSLTF
jgi:hypothetical protein